MIDAGVPGNAAEIERPDFPRTFVDATAPVEISAGKPAPESSDGGHDGSGNPAVRRALSQYGRDQSH